MIHPLLAALEAIEHQAQQAITRLSTGEAVSGITALTRIRDEASDACRHFVEQRERDAA